MDFVGVARRAGFLLMIPFSNQTCLITSRHLFVDPSSPLGIWGKSRLGG